MPDATSHPNTSSEPRQVLVHPALIEPLEKWLGSMNLGMRCIGKTSEDDLPSWVIEVKH